MPRVKILLRVASMLILLCLAACASDTGQGADTVFFNARAYTLDSAAPWAEAVAVKDDGKDIRHCVGRWLSFDQPIQRRVSKVVRVYAA